MASGSEGEGGVSIVMWVGTGVLHMCPCNNHITSGLGHNLPSHTRPQLPTARQCKRHCKRLRKGLRKHGLHCQVSTAHIMPLTLVYFGLVSTTLPPPAPDTSRVFRSAAAAAAAGPTPPAVPPAAPSASPPAPPGPPAPAPWRAAAVGPRPPAAPPPAPPARRAGRVRRVC